MPEEKGALDDFQKDFDYQVDDSLNNDFPKTVEEGADTDTSKDNEDGTEEPRKNRQHRRVSAKLAAEMKALEEVRTMNIEEAAKRRAYAEMEQLRDKPLDERLLTLYGSDENGKRAAQITASLLEDAVARAREEAVNQFKSAQVEKEREIEDNQKLIENNLEDLEDSYGVDFTSGTAEARRNRSEFLDLVTQFSPKEADGSISDYADFDTVFQAFQNARRTGNNTRQKDLASRGMARGGSSQQKVGDKVAERYLKDIGII